MERFLNFLTQLIYSQPYQIHDFQGSESKKKQNNLIESEIYENYFCSKAVMVRFFDEKTTLNDICSFRLEFDCLKKQEVYLVCELMHSDMKRIVSQKINESLYNLVSTFTATINLSDKFINQYLPIFFGEKNYCLVDTTIFITPIEMKFIKDKKESNTFRPQSFIELLNQMTHRCKA